MIFLTACASNQTQIDESKLNDCVIYSIEGDTVEDALVQSILNIESLELCNRDKKSIREYYNLGKKD